MSEAIQPIVMPKWGLAMQEGMLAAWHVEAGTTLKKGQEIADIETSKIANVFESPADGELRRLTAEPGETLPVGALIAVIAPADVDEAAIDAFVAEFQERFAAAASEVEAAPEPQTIEAGGRRLRYLEQGAGEGPPVLLLHGFGGDHLGWMFNHEALAEDRRVIALDLPGHGGSSKDVGDGALPVLKEAVLAFMDALDIEKAHLVGHSMGGALGLLLLKNHAERLASLTLVASGGLGEEINQEFLDGFIKEKRAKKLRPILERLVARPEAVTPEMVEEVIRFKRLDGAEAALSKLRDALAQNGKQPGSLRRVLDGTKVPVLVVWGKQDRILPASHAEDLPEGIEVVLLDDAGHLPHMEKAGEVNERLRGHLAKAG